TPEVIPGSCPTCHRELVRHQLAGAGLPASACPDGHGAWLSPDVAEALRGLVDRRTATAHRRELALVSAMAGFSLIVLTILTLPSLPRGTLPAPTPETSRAAPVSVAPTPIASERVDEAALSETYWPERRWPGARPIPLKESHLDVYEELRYFDQLMELLEMGITNRLNMEGVLVVDRPPARYTALYEVYRQRQGEVLDRMRQLAVPGRLQPVHEPIVRATERQIAFYGEFARAKTRDHTTDLRRMLAHPTLREQNEALHEAWARVNELYPDLDQPTHQTIYHHLCGFDTI
ncbi:MAG TPA: hypothetical protein VLV15_05360, partial [Dongiaceae bacterium]|nr:hypothetical protein [Dongiaceae bacterium]